MKTKIPTIFLSISFLVIMSGLNGQNRITVTLDRFTKLSVSGDAHVELVPSHSHKMSIVASNGKPEEVEYEIRNGELMIWAKTDLMQERETNIKLPYEKLISIEASTGAVINSREDLDSEDLYLRSLSGGKIELTVNTRTIDARVTQISDIILYGSTNSQKVVANTGGNYLAYDLDCKETYVKSSAGAQAKVKAAKKIEASANSKGFISFIGNPESKQISTSLGGTIEELKRKPDNEH